MRLFYPFYLLPGPSILQPFPCFIHLVQAESKDRPLILVSGFIHDVSSFLNEHPGGKHLLTKNIGRDATTAFHGGVYDHSNAAHNLLAMMRVGVLSGGLEQESEKAIPPSQKLRILRAGEIKAIARSSARAAVEGNGSEEAVREAANSAVYAAGYVSVAAAAGEKAKAS